MKVELLATPTAFDTLSGEWDGLLDPERSTNFFLQLGWQRVWWRHLQRGDLSIATIRDDEGVLRGIAPWAIETHLGQRIVYTIGCIDVTDYLDIIITPGYQDEVLAALLDFMLSSEAPPWDVMDLCNFPEDSSTLPLLPLLAEARGLEARVRQQEVCPLIALPSNFDEYLSLLDKKQRHEMRRKLRRAQAQGVDWYIVGQEDDLEAEIEAYLTLMAKSTPDKAAFLEMPGHRPFFKEMGELMFAQGHLQLCFLTVNGERAAALWNFIYRGRLMVYNSGLDPFSFPNLSAGVVLSGLTIQYAIEQGVEKYDFLRGNEDYKYRLGGQDTAIYNIVIRR